MPLYTRVFAVRATFLTKLEPPAYPARGLDIILGDRRYALRSTDL